MKPPSQGMHLLHLKIDVLCVRMFCRMESRSLQLRIIRRRSHSAVLRERDPFFSGVRFRYASQISGNSWTAICHKAALRSSVGCCVRKNPIDHVVFGCAGHSPGSRNPVYDFRNSLQRYQVPVSSIRSSGSPGFPPFLHICFYIPGDHHYSACVFKNLSYTCTVTALCRFSLPPCAAAAVTTISRCLSICQCCITAAFSACAICLLLLPRFPLCLILCLCYDTAILCGSFALRSV